MNVTFPSVLVVTGKHHTARLLRACQRCRGESGQARISLNGGVLRQDVRVACHYAQHGAAGAAAAALVATREREEGNSPGLWGDRAGLLHNGRRETGEKRCAHTV